MESGVTQEYKKSNSESQNVEIAESVDNFQKMLYELFEKNGIINDLRAYLRGHIINVLKSTQSGGLPPCQKHFIQRLELSFQALNILIAEYLLRLEFTYSLSVFLSEIPLANMVFHFAKTLMQKSSGDDLQDMRFTENDVWSILNYLGVPCDSEHASHIIQMYKNDKKTSLLICILKCQWLYKKVTVDRDKGSEETLSSQSSALSAVETQDNSQGKIQPKPEKCKHIKYCKTCQKQILNIKDKYKNKKKRVFQMFHQLKSVYESEVEMMKTEEEKKIKRSMASHALQLQKEREEMEQSFKAREADLERTVTEKKKFLWGLARALRDQHQHMSRAMHDIRVETNRLTAKEDSLRTQMVEAEQILQKRGEEMRLQISNELSILEAHLNSMKKERECINKERMELENLKAMEKNTSENHKIPHIDAEVNSHYDLLRNELEILKKYLESSKVSPKCVIERGTVTDLFDVNSKLSVGLNNHNPNTDRSRHDDFDDRLKNQVVNDFKKKNVNFRQSNLDEIYRDRSHTRSHSSGSSETGDIPRPSSVVDQRDFDTDLIHALREENMRLKECSRHQQAHIEALSRTAPCVCLGAGPQPAPRARPRTAPPTAVSHVASADASTPATYQPSQFLRNMNTSVSANPVSLGWRKGAGEEFSLFCDAQPRVLVPGDTIPFVGVLRDRHNVNKRQIVGQWRAVRSRTCPLVGVSKRSVSPYRDRQRNSSPEMSYPKASCSLQPDHSISKKTTRNKSPRPQTTSDTKKNRDKSPKSVLKEAKAKLRNIKDVSIAAQEKSPSSVLREAKLRLRKLEIEAEAMEKSYLNFRRRQSELKLERSANLMIRDSKLGQGQELANLSKGCRSDRVHPHENRSGILDGTKRTYSLHKLDNTSTCQMNAPLTDYKKSMRHDFDKYLQEYQTKITDIHFKSQTVADIVSPIPVVYKEVNVVDTKVNTCNYLETPLAEFRKFYNTNRKNVERTEKVKDKYVSSKVNKFDVDGTIKSDGTHQESSKPEVKVVRCSKMSELEILKQNINKMYNITDNTETELKEEKSEEPNVDEQNLLRVEVENMNEINENQNISVVVQSTVIDAAVIPIITDNNSVNHVSFGEKAIILSPKASTPRNDKSLSRDFSPESIKRSLSPEQQAHLTRNDVFDVIFNEDENKQKSNTDNINQDILDGSDKLENFADNLSADVDNYNSQTDLPNSPISLVRDLQNSEDENFWD